MEMKLEVVVVPVSDVDRAKAFYGGLAGGRTPTSRPTRCTPPGSACSIIFGENVTTGLPGSLQDLQLTVFDIDAARAALIDRASYGSFASFSDPDGNGCCCRRSRNGFRADDIGGLTDGRCDSGRAAARDSRAP